MAGRHHMTGRPEIGSRIGALLDAVWRAGGSDLLITVGMPPQMRVRGELLPVPGQFTLESGDTDSLLAELLSPSQAASWRVNGEYDFSFSWRDDARVRASA